MSTEQSNQLSPTEARLQEINPILLQIAQRATETALLIDNSESLLPIKSIDTMQFLSTHLINAYLAGYIDGVKSMNQEEA